MARKAKRAILPVTVSLEGVAKPESVFGHRIGKRFIGLALVLLGVPLELLSRAFGWAATTVRGWKKRFEASGGGHRTPPRGSPAALRGAQERREPSDGPGRQTGRRRPTARRACSPSCVAHGGVHERHHGVVGAAVRVVDKGGRGVELRVRLQRIAARAVRVIADAGRVEGVVQEERHRHVVLQHPRHRAPREDALLVCRGRARRARVSGHGKGA